MQNLEYPMKPFPFHSQNTSASENPYLPTIHKEVTQPCHDETNIFFRCTPNTDLGIEQETKSQVALASDDEGHCLCKHQFL